MTSLVLAERPTKARGVSASHPPAKAVITVEPTLPKPERSVYTGNLPFNMVNYPGLVAVKVVSDRRTYVGAAAGHLSEKKIDELMRLIENNQINVNIQKMPGLTAWYIEKSFLENWR